METHLCDRRAVTTEQLKEIILGSKRRTDGYKCAGCSKSFQTICVLHYHCMKHGDGGSFFFDHVTRTAYPKHDSTCSYTQVDSDLIDGYFNDETKLADDGSKVLETTAREINQHPLYIRTKVKVDSVLDSTTVSEERDTEVPVASIKIGKGIDYNQKDISFDDVRLENSVGKEIEDTNDKESSVKEVEVTNKIRRSKRLIDDKDSPLRKASSTRKDVTRVKVRKSDALNLQV